MRRFLTFLTAVTLLVGSLAVGTFTADLPFWRRAFDLPLAPGEEYAPALRAGMDSAAVPEPAGSAVDGARFEPAAALARAAHADALLVMHHGHVVFERYFRAPADPDAWLPADFLARPLAAMALGIAYGEGRIGSPDDRVSKYLAEWEDDPRGAITLRQLLDETSGLEPGEDAARVLGSRPFADWSGMPRFATSRGVRLLLGNDFASTALGFELLHEPGGFFHVSSANAQLAALVVQRATGMPYADFLDRRLLTPARIMVEMQMDRMSGMPAAHCCLRARGRDALRLADQLRADEPASRLLPAAWLAQMRAGSRANPEFGLQIARAAGAAGEYWQLGGDRGGAAWIAPDAAVTAVLLAHRDVPVSAGVRDAVLAALRK